MSSEFSKTMAWTSEPVLRRRFCCDRGCGRVFHICHRATEVSATAAKSVNNDVVVSNVGRGIVCTKKVLKAGWITEIASARTGSV